MQRNLLHHQRALFLRKKKGYSYNEILAEIPVAKSTLSGWLHAVELSPAQKRRLLQKQEKHWRESGLGEWNRKKRQEEIVKIRAEARAEVKELTHDQFFVCGIMLHWAEGDKGGKRLRISNADPIFIRLIMRWFRDILKISEDRFVAVLHYHAGQDELAIKKYWSKVTGIPLSQFQKSFCKPPGTGHRKHYLRWGVIGIRIRRGANLFHRIAGWREGLIADIISGT